LKQDTSLIHKSKINDLENVLVMQGGGSLGAYECGVYKTLAKHKINFNIIAGTSIGAINASLIVGSKDDQPEKTLEEFWIDVADKTMPDFFTKEMQTFYSTTSAFFGAILKLLNQLFHFRHILHHFFHICTIQNHFRKLWHNTLSLKN